MIFWPILRLEAQICYPNSAARGSLGENDCTGTKKVSLLEGTVGIGSSSISGLLINTYSMLTSSRVSSLSILVEPHDLSSGVSWT